MHALMKWPWTTTGTMPYCQHWFVTIIIVNKQNSCFFWRGVNYSMNLPVNWLIVCTYTCTRMYSVYSAADKVTKWCDTLTDFIGIQWTDLHVYVVQWNLSWIHIHVHVYIYNVMYIFTCTIYMFTCTCTCVCMHMYIHTHYIVSFVYKLFCSKVFAVYIVRRTWDILKLIKFKHLSLPDLHCIMLVQC